MQKEATLKIVSVVFSLIMFAICIFLLGQLVGFRQGAKWGSRPASEVIKDDVILSGGTGPSAYDAFVLAYATIAFCLVLYGIVRLYKIGRFSQYIPAIPLLVILYKFTQLVQWKKLYLELNADVGYYYWIINSIPYDWFCLITTVGLLVTQIVTILVSYRSQGSEKLAKIS